jgi:hypothetical protein
MGGGEQYFQDQKKKRTRALHTNFIVQSSLLLLQLPPLLWLEDAPDGPINHQSQ